MTDRRITLFAIAASLLLITAVPVTVADTSSGAGLVVGSEHTDFGTGDESSPQTLENLSVQGSGDDASVVLDGGSTGVTTRPSDTGSDSVSTEHGLRVNATTDIQRFDAVVSSQASGLTTAYLYYASNGTLIETTSVTDGAANFSSSLNAGTEYWILGDADGNSYTRGYNEDKNNPYTGDHLDIYGGIYDGNQGTGSVYNFKSIQTYVGTETSATYQSATHAVSNAEEAAINIEQLSNVSVDAKVRTDGGTVLNQTTLSSTGNHTLTLAETSSSQLETVLDITVTGENPQFDLSDESILFTNHAPSGSNPTPTGPLTTSEPTFELDVSDPEFGTAQGDRVNASLYVDGEYAGSKIATQNRTVSVTEEISGGGNHSYYWRLEDSYGATTTTSTYNVTVPGTLYIRSETDPGQLVTDAQVNLTYYAGDQIYRRTTSDGTVDLSGLPIDQPIIALAQADGYFTRTAIITSVYEQDSLYLLNDSITSHQIIFDITDPTGEYPGAETALMVQRDINLSGTVEWRTVAGDVFGAQGVVTDLEAGERYRLVIRNLETGDRTVLGAFTPTGDQAVTLEPASAVVDINVSSDTAIGYGGTRSSDGESLIVEYSDPDQTTDTLTFRVVERWNNSNVLLENQTYNDLGNLTYELPLDPAAQNTTWAVEFHWELDNGDTASVTVPVGQGSQDIIPGVVDSVIRVSVGVFVLLITSLLFSELNVGVGAVTTALIGALLWYTGFLAGVTSGPAVVLAIAVGLLTKYNEDGGVVG